MESKGRWPWGGPSFRESGEWGAKNSLFRMWGEGRKSAAPGPGCAAGLLQPQGFAPNTCRHSLDQVNLVPDPS